MPFCTHCGNDLGTNAFCSNCGAPAAVTKPPAAPSPPEPDTAVRPVVPLAYVPPLAPPAYVPPLAPVTPAFATAPAPDGSGRSRWTPAKVFGAAGVLLGIGACGFLLTYVLNPLLQDDDTIPPPLPQLASSSSQTFAEAPAPGSTEGDAYEQLRRIAAQDRAALQSSQQWRAQLASSPAAQSPADFLRVYQGITRKMPNALLAWSGDWPNSYGPSSQSSWVIVSQFTEATTRPVINWCVHGHRGCWAKRLSEVGVPDDNTDHPPADPNKN